MTYIHKILGFIFAFCLILILLISSIEFIIYGIPNYFEYEYSKYGVHEEIDIAMEDLLYVTDEMMSYLRGNREDLHIDTIVGGISQEFFNEREIAHMVDVQHLFLAGIAIRNVSIIILIICIAFLYFTKANIKLLLPKSIFLAFGTFITLLLAFGIYTAIDFTRAFIQFHHIFFNNDLWILDPSTDLLINIVPEPFFMDTAFYIMLTFTISLLTVLITAILIHRKNIDCKNKC
jgi:integral membrane protein TIGR01906